jgi:hypothetical protein
MSSSSDFLMPVLDAAILMNNIYEEQRRVLNQYKENAEKLQQELMERVRKLEAKINALEEENRVLKEGNPSPESKEKGKEEETRDVEGTDKNDNEEQANMD